MTFNLNLPSCESAIPKAKIIAISVFKVSRKKIQFNKLFTNLNVTVYLKI